MLYIYTCTSGHSGQTFMFDFLEIAQNLMKHKNNDEKNALLSSVLVNQRLRDTTFLGIFKF